MTPTTPTQTSEARAAEAHETLPSFMRPRPERSAASLLLLLLLLAALALAAYTVLDGRVLHKSAHDPQGNAPAGMQNPPPDPSSTLGRPPRPVASQEPIPGAASRADGRRLVIKCISKGQVSYSDHACPDGAEVKSLLIDPKLNLADAPSLPSRPAINPPTAGVAANPPQADPLPVAQMPSNECLWLAAEINRLDQLARQAQPPAMQDYLRTQRKQHRDRQAELNC